jgi:hypothetical protein
VQRFIILTYSTGQIRISHPPSIANFHTYISVYLLRSRKIRDQINMGILGERGGFFSSNRAFVLINGYS